MVSAMDTFETWLLIVSKGFNVEFKGGDGYLKAFVIYFALVIPLHRILSIGFSCSNLKFGTDGNRI